MIDDVRPHPTAMRTYELCGNRFRVYLTTDGSIASDRFDAKTGTWQHAPLAEVDRGALREILAYRSSTLDEQIARHIAACVRHSTRPRRHEHTRAVVTSSLRPRELVAR